MWSEMQIAQHKEAAKKLSDIVESVGVFLRTKKDCTEVLVQKYIQQEMKRLGLRMDSHAPIVAFGKSTSHVHYFPGEMGNKKLKQNTLVLIDVWARCNVPSAPYADMTWMFFVGKKIPARMASEFAVLSASRDAALTSLQKQALRNLPIFGNELDSIAREYLSARGLGKYFVHSLGHSLGTVSPHGTFAGLQKRAKTPLRRSMGYTIEPGIYIPGRYGLRTEISGVLYSKKFSVTTPIQLEITLIHR